MIEQYRNLGLTGLMEGGNECCLFHVEQIVLVLKGCREVGCSLLDEILDRNILDVRNDSNSIDEHADGITDAQVASAVRDSTEAYIWIIGVATYGIVGSSKEDA